MARHNDVIRVADAKDFRTKQSRSQDGGMRAIGQQGINRLKARQRGSMAVSKRHIPANSRNGATGARAAQEMPARCTLKVKAQLRMRRNGMLVKSGQRNSG